MKSKIANTNGSRLIMYLMAGMVSGLKILCTAPLQACRQDPGAGPGETQSDSHFPKEFPDSFPRNSHPMSSLERRAQRR